MSRTLLVLDLFCGLGGFSKAFRERGHRVIGVDIVPPCEVQADVKRLPFPKSFRPDVILASPPCTEYAREWMPWSRTGKEPDHSLMHAAYKAVATYKPRWWVIENVRGAVQYWPPYRLRIGSRFLWGKFPIPALLPNEAICHGKERLGPTVKDRARVRAIIPYPISLALCQSIEAA